MKQNALLAKSIKEGDEAAFELFFRAEYNNVVTFLNRYLRNSLLAQDVAQESFIALWQKREQIDAAGNIRAYIFTIARNRALNEMALKINQTRTEWEKNELAIAIEAMNDPDLVQDIQALELKELIRKVYLELPEKVAESFILSRECGLSYEEIAQKKGITKKIVEYRIRIALQVFKKRLKDYMYFFLFHIVLLLSLYFYLFYSFDLFLLL